MSGTPPLRGRGLRLEPLTTGHAAELVEVLADPAVHTFSGGSPPSLQRLEARFARQVAGPRDDTYAWHSWVVRLGDGGPAVGYVQATVLGDEGVAELSWVVGTPWQGKGVASDAAAVVVELLVASGVARVLAHIHPDHVASQRVAASVGLAPTSRLVGGEVEWERRLGIRGVS